MEKYQNHSSIKLIRENINSTINFSFDLINLEFISKIKNYLDTSKQTQQREVKGVRVKYELRATSSNARVTSSNPRVRRLKARVPRLKARVRRLKARVR